MIVVTAVASQWEIGGLRFQVLIEAQLLPGLKPIERCWLFPAGKTSAASL